MSVVRLGASLLVASVALFAASAHAAPKAYVLTGKLTSTRGLIIDIPLIGPVPCNGVGQSNLTVGMGPGGAFVPAPNTPAGPFPGANADPFGCVPHVPARKITTTGSSSWSSMASTRSARCGK